jgi:hypothetical protein
MAFFQRIKCDILVVSPQQTLGLDRSCVCNMVGYIGVAKIRSSIHLQVTYVA